MGQYHIPVNLDKREFINPHLLNNGLKMLEWGQGGGTTVALTVLLACSHKRGGGDLMADDAGADKIMGRWAGDRIVVLGDYTEPGDPGTASLYEELSGELPVTISNGNLHPWEYVHEVFTDISLACREVIRMDDWIAEEIPAELPDYLTDAASESTTLSNL